MNLIAKIFGTRSLSTIPAHTVYLQPGQSMSLLAAIEAVRSSADQDFMAQCMSHYSGYLREAAISRAVELGGDAPLEAIAKRVNDWVPEVRRAATNALLTLFATVPADHFVPLVPRLRDLMLATREDHRSWVFEFERRLIEAGGTEAIVAAMTGADFRLRRAAVLLGIDHQVLSVTETIEIGLNSGDVVLARSAVALLDRLPTPDRLEYIARATESSFGSIRFAAFNLIASADSNSGYEPFLWRATLDPQGSLRSAAARLLRGRGRDVIGHCTAILHAGNLTSMQVRAALSLLVELRAPDTLRTLNEYAQCERTEIRAHAVALQAKVSPTQQDEIASRALLDPSRKVRKIGVRLCARGAFVCLGLIKTMLVRHGDRHAAMTICARDRWDSLACIGLITEICLPAHRDRLDMSQALKRWIEDPRAAWTKPSGEQRLLISNPEARARLAALAGERQAQLCARLKEGGIEG